jgi:signal peptidase I
LCRRILIGPALLVGVILGSLRPLGLIRPFSVPTVAMTPAIARGDHIMMEGVTFLVRKPQRGDIVVFRRDGIASLPADAIYNKRVVGEPGERLSISDGKLYVNGRHVALRNGSGEIHYVFLPGSTYLASADDTVTVPEGHYFVLGDNSSNSSDSRNWGFLPATNVMGRVSVCFWPPSRIGAVR